MTPSHTARAAALVGKARSTTGTNPYTISFQPVKGDVADLVEITGSCDGVPTK
jgi:hypothetical protein